MFVLPLIVILLAVAFGIKAEHIEKFRQSKRDWMKLIAGIVLILLAIFMFLLR
jgi:cytochrome c biogenesis protein CcdA